MRYDTGLIELGDSELHGFGVFAKKQDEYNFAKLAKKMSQKMPEQIVPRNFAR